MTAKQPMPHCNGVAHSDASLMLPEHPLRLLHSSGWPLRQAWQLPQLMLGLNVTRSPTWKLVMLSSTAAVVPTISWPGDEGECRVEVARVDVEVGAADAGLDDLDQHLAGPGVGSGISVMLNERGAS
jgi:hypothetical protein